MVCCRKGGKNGLLCDLFLTCSHHIYIICHLVDAFTQRTKLLYIFFKLADHIQVH